MAKCFDDVSMTERQSQECVQNHARYLEAIQNMMQNELNGLNNRIQRGQSSCQDEVQNKFVSIDSPSDQSKAQAMYEKCSLDLVKAQIDSLKSARARIDKNIDKIMTQR